ncbi:hypothetical protein DNFV4_02121 [Nitrospira tepida]|uniref:Uncharacterized protein n=1 Tax=Nitrospira tepida TaxID=2973512 RepID=A0AA86MZ29_9BACT|nr:hypothetical protein DNFV4_02121 [Nitrospira tepida]
MPANSQEMSIYRGESLANYAEKANESGRISSSAFRGNSPVFEPPRISTAHLGVRSEHPCFIGPYRRASSVGPLAARTPLTRWAHPIYPSRAWLSSLLQELSEPRILLACPRLIYTSHSGCFRILRQACPTVGSSALTVPPLPSALPRSRPQAFPFSALCTTATTLFLPRRVSPAGFSPTKTGRHMGPPLQQVALTHPSPRWMAGHRLCSLSPPIHLPHRPIDSKPATTRPPSSPRLESRPDLSDFHKSAARQNHPQKTTRRLGLPRRLRMPIPMATGPRRAGIR